MKFLSRSGTSVVKRKLTVPVNSSLGFSLKNSSLADTWNERHHRALSEIARVPTTCTYYSKRLRGLHSLLTNDVFLLLRVPRFVQHTVLTCFSPCAFHRNVVLCFVYCAFLFFFFAIYVISRGKRVENKVGRRVGETLGDERTKGSTKDNGDQKTSYLWPCSP